MKPTRQALIIGSAARAVVGAAVVARSQVPNMNADARWIVGLASTVFPAAAAGAVAVRRGMLRWVAGLGLVVCPAAFVRTPRSADAGS